MLVHFPPQLQRIQCKRLAFVSEKDVRNMAPTRYLLQGYDAGLVYKAYIWCMLVAKFRTLLKSCPIRTPMLTKNVVQKMSIMFGRPKHCQIFLVMLVSCSLQVCPPPPGQNIARSGPPLLYVECSFSRSGLFCPPSHGLRCRGTHFAILFTELCFVNL